MKESKRGNSLINHSHGTVAGVCHPGARISLLGNGTNCVFANIFRNLISEILAVKEGYVNTRTCLIAERDIRPGSGKTKLMMKEKLKNQLRIRLNFK